MIVLAFQTAPGSPRGPVVLLLIVEKENLDRMRQADPFDCKLTAFLGPANPQQATEIQVRPLAELDVVVAYEEDLNQIMRFHEKHDLAGLLTWLERGRKIEAEDLGPPVPLRRN